MSNSNDFCTIATGGSANVESQASWVADAVRTNGFQSGIANSAQINKVLRQWLDYRLDGRAVDR